jgi:hypothetical protein
MKRIIFFMALQCLYVNIQCAAQTDSSGSNYNGNISYTANIDNALANISKQYISTGI